jgi:hypothetical protein
LIKDQPDQNPTRYISIFVIILFKPLNINSLNQIIAGFQEDGCHAKLAVDVEIALASSKNAVKSLHRGILKDLPIGFLKTALHTLYTMRIPTGYSA